MPGLDRPRGLEAHDRYCENPGDYPGPACKISGRSADHPEPKYPSSFGGKHLLEEIFRFTGAVRWPEKGNEHWDDFALFYLGGVVTVQGFVDGNKRVGKLVYALTLIKGGRPFRAPVPKFENELFKMN